jgi:hypothetical protein
MRQTTTNILFVPGTVTIITHVHKQTHSIYIKSHIVSSQEFSYMFQRYVTILRETLLKRNIKFIRFNTVYVNWMH